MTDVPNLALEYLRARVNSAGSQTAAAKELGIPLSQLNEVLSGRRDISKGMLEKIGFDKVEIHIRKEDRVKLVRAINPTVVTFGRSGRHV